MREAMRAQLTEAMRARDTGTRDALRTALAAIENAEAVPPAVGVTEVARRALTDAEVVGIVGEEIERLDDAAAELESLGRHDRADELRRQAAVLRRFV